MPRIGLMNFFVVFFLLFPFFDNNHSLFFVCSFPSGAGGCPGKQAAVGGVHLDSTRHPRSGPLSDGDVVVSIDGILLQPNTTTTGYDFPINTDLQISVQSNGTIQYSGILIRMKAPRGTRTRDALRPGSDGLTQIANACNAPVIGLTHIDSTTKSITSGIIHFSEEAIGVAFDITIVYQNNDFLGSAYSYSRFKTNFLDIGTIPPSDMITSTLSSTYTSAVPFTDTPTDIPSNFVTPEATSLSSPDVSKHPTSVSSTDSRISDSPSTYPTLSPSLQPTIIIVNQSYSPSPTTTDLTDAPSSLNNQILSTNTAITIPTIVPTVSIETDEPTISTISPSGTSSNDLSSLEDKPDRESSIPREQIFDSLFTALSILQNEPAFPSVFDKEVSDGAYDDESAYEESLEENDVHPKQDKQKSVSKGAPSMFNGESLLFKDESSVVYSKTSNNVDASVDMLSGNGKGYTPTDLKTKKDKKNSDPKGEKEYISTTRTSNILERGDRIGSKKKMGHGVRRRRLDFEIET